MPLDAKILDEYKKRRKEVFAAGGEAKVQKRHDKGLMTARERLMYLYQPDTFQEVGGYIKHHCTSFGMEEQVFAGDGVVTGTGYVDGRQVTDAADIRSTLERQVTGTVRWVDALATLRTLAPDAVFVELGPGKVLTGLLAKNDREAVCHAVEDLDSLEAAVEVLG